jgi:TRAP-type mannitol/chloroaromatic compound transport system permease large subunit
MDPLSIGILSVVAIILLILLGLHVAVALALTGFGAIYAITGRFGVAASLLYNTAQSGVADYVFAVIPLFVVMGLFATQAGATRDLFAAAAAMTGRLRGGLGVATVGRMRSSPRSPASRSPRPRSSRSSPCRRWAGSATTGASRSASSLLRLLGMLIPPSVLMIVYGVIAEQSIGKLFAAGVVPGLLVAFALAAMIVIRAR